jgi:hypothetical protein
MPKTTPNWAADVDQFFKDNPKRQFYVRDADPFNLMLAALVFEVLGYASQPINDDSYFRIIGGPDPRPLPVVIRRASHAEGRAKHQIIALDGGILPPPFDKDYGQDDFGRWVFLNTLSAGKMGKSLVDFMDEANGAWIKAG